MVKRGKAKKAVVVSDLNSFKTKEEKKQKEKEPQQTQEITEPSQQTGQSQADVNRAEEAISKFQPLEFSIQTFYKLDNKLIDAYYVKRENFNEEERDHLEAEEFQHFVRLLCKDLEYILNLNFVKFWGVITKMPEVLRFLDDFLQNVRKHNDLYKLQFLDVQSLSKIKDKGGESQIKESMNKVLNDVLRIFYRLSQPTESEEDFMSLPFYQKIIYDNWIFDMAKLIDMAAIYSRSNQETVRKLIENVFENDKRFVQDFKEGIDLMLNLLKKLYKDAIRVD